MHYTVATLCDVHTEQEYSFNKKGNKYYVGLWLRGTEEYHRSREMEFAEATTLYFRMTDWVINGLHNYEDRLQEIQNA